MSGFSGSPRCGALARQMGRACQGPARIPPTGSCTSMYVLYAGNTWPACLPTNAKCPYYVVRSIQSVLIIKCFVRKVSLLFSALYATCPHYLVRQQDAAQPAAGHTPGGRVR